MPIGNAVAPGAVVKLTITRQAVLGAPRERHASLDARAGLASALATQLRDAAAALDEPTPAAPASPSTEEPMSQQPGARGNDRDQHQLLECLRRNSIAHMLSDVHAEHDWQHRSRRD